MMKYAFDSFSKAQDVSYVLMILILRHVTIL